MIGISDFAQSELGDVVYTEVPEVGSTVTRGEPFAAVESVKSASDIYSPVSGEVLEVNEVLEENPALVNDDAEGASYFAKIRLTNMAELDDMMDTKAYETHCDA